MCRPCERIKSKEKNEKRLRNITLDYCIRLKVWQCNSRHRNHRTKKYAEPCNITCQYVKDLWHKQEEKCCYSGIKMTYKTNNYNLFSIDRIDSSRGYVVGNIALCCHGINLMKNDMDMEEFFNYCYMITDHNRKT